MTAEPTHPIEPAAPHKPLDSAAKRVKAALSAYRVPLLGLAASVFAVGLAISISRLDLALSDIALGYIALSAMIFVPVAFVYGAANFMIMARGAGVKVSFASAFKTSCVAQFAEFLPIPGGAIVRGGALMRQGTRAASAAAHVTINALLWVACAAMAGGLSLGLENTIALIIALCGLAGILACTLWIATRAGILIAIAALVMRVVGLFIAGARLFAAFAAIGFVVAWLDLYPFVFATIAGSAAAIAPGGLGISEAAAAALALLSNIPPEAAFLAVGLNRLIGFAVSGIATGIITFTSSSDRAQA